MLLCGVLVATSLLIVEQTLHVKHRPLPRSFHPEVPQRLEAAAAALRKAPFAEEITWRSAGDSVSAAEAEAALRGIHSAEHIDAVQRMSQTGGDFDADTYCAPGSWEALVDGTAAWMEALDVAACANGPSLALARPPGHHATEHGAMGFCLVNFAAAAVVAHLRTHPNARVAVLDWDVHHGNGIAEILSEHARARYCSTHEAGSFPRTGLNQTDRGPLANILNLPLPSGASGTTYLRALRRHALPFLLGGEDAAAEGWGAPDVLLICAGYDGLDGDMVAGLRLHPEDFAESIRAICDEMGFPAHQIAMGLEGGYDLDPWSGMPGGLVRTTGALIRWSS